ncbi:MAG: hypothetical protein ACOCQQ_01830 [Candidatus Nanoarchaeia archaeon]
MQDNSSKIANKTNEVFYSDTAKNSSEVFIPKKRIKELKDKEHQKSQEHIAEKDAAIDAFIPGFDSQTNNPYMAKDVFFPKVDEEQNTQDKKIPLYIKPLLEDISQTSTMCINAIKQGAIRDAQQLYSMLRERLIGISVHSKDKELVNDRMKKLYSQIRLASLEFEAKQLLNK